jgi:transcription elongation factor GreA-like protein
MSTHEITTMELEAIRDTLTQIQVEGQTDDFFLSYSLEDALEESIAIINNILMNSSEILEAVEEIVSG